MAIYHLEAKIVSRGAGRSAVAAAAYLSCSRMLNEYDGVQHDYTRKQGLGWRQVFLPASAPAEWQDREILWNAVEETETAKDSRLAREFVAALPIELSREEQIQLLQDFIKEQFVADGMCADAAIHDPYPPGHNPHAHILLTVRPLDEKGKWQHKTEKEYLCVKGGEERGFTAAEFKQAQADGWEKQYQYKVGKKKVYMAPSAAQAQGFDPVQLYEARQTIRPGKEQEAENRAQQVYGEKYNPLLMLDSKKAVARMLHEDMERQAVRRLVRQAQKEQQTFQKEKIVPTFQDIVS